MSAFDDLLKEHDEQELRSIKKESFLLHVGQRSSVESLSDKDAGQLFKAIFQYADDMTLRDNLSPLAKLAFSFFKERLDTERAHYLEIVFRNRSNGNKSKGRPRKPKETQGNPKNPVGNLGYSEKPKKPSGGDTDTGTESQKRDKEENKKKTGSSSFSKPIEERQQDFWNELHQEKHLSKYGEDMIKQFYSYWAEGEQNKAKPRMRKELQPTWNTSGRLATWNSRKESAWK